MCDILRKLVIENLQNESVDFHTRTAASAYNIKPSEVTPEQRRNAKAFNYGRFYSMSPEDLLSVMGLGEE